MFLRGAKQLLTLRGPSGVRRGAALSDLGVIPDGSVLIRDGRIVSLGSTRRMENLREARAAVEVPVHGKVVMPGFIDVGLQLSLNRASQTERPRRAIEFVDDSLTLLRSCLQHGTVLVKVHVAADRHSLQSDVAILRKLAKIGDNPVRMMRTWRLDSTLPLGPESEAEQWRETLQTLLKRRLINCISLRVDAEHEPDWASLEPMRAAGIPMDLLWAGGPVTLFGDVLRRLRPALVCPSCPLSEPEAMLLASAGSIAVLPAGKQVFEGDGTSAARTLIDGGGALVLSSGYHSALAPNFNMQMAIALAVVRLGLTPEEAITACTINAAHAAGCAHLAGSLEIGKRADIAVLNIPDVRELPLQFGVNHVAMVFREGGIVCNRTRWRAPTESAAAHRVRAKSV